MIFTRTFNLTRHLKRTEATIYPGPPHWQERVNAPSVREAYCDLDGLDAAAIERAKVIAFRKGGRK
jgi:hypothetical protein